MSDSSESESGMALALEQTQKLFQLDPNHELLRLWKDSKNDAVWEEFQTRFGKEGITEEVRSSERGQAYFWTQYFLALKAANDAIAASST